MSISVQRTREALGMSSARRRSGLCPALGTVPGEGREMTVRWGDSPPSAEHAGAGCYPKQLSSLGPVTVSWPVRTERWDF